MPSRTLIVAVLSFSIMAALAATTVYINFWPDDSYHYVPTAARVFDLPFISQIHGLSDYDLTRINMRAKEALILGISIFQKLLNDNQSLYPNVLLLIVATGISGILIYRIIGTLYGERVGFIAYLLFAFSFWPYLYILQGAHPPLALMFFLLAVWARFPWLSGIFLGLMFFSSPTASLYLPYYLTWCWFKRTQWRQALLIFAGWLVVFLYFTWPDPAGSLTQFSRFLSASQKENHFTTYHDYLSSYFAVPEVFRGGGWVWILKYLWLTMPVMFAGYLLALGYVLKNAFYQRSLILLILLSLSTPLLVETSQVAQFGRNYFPWLIGMILLISYALAKQPVPQTKAKTLLWIFLGSHILFNVWIFSRDIFPSRMATAWIEQWLRKHNVTDVFVYQNHPLNRFLVQVLNNPKYKEKIKFWGIKTIHDADKGYILVPPSTGKNIWQNCAVENFDADPALTDLYKRGPLSKYAAASFKTLASSRVWAQEEEVCSYLDLMLGRITADDRKKGEAYILRR